MTSKERKLMNAIRANLVNTARRLLEEGVDVNSSDAFRNTPVMGVRSVEMLNLCIEHGANLNMKNKNMDSVLTVWVKRFDREKWGVTNLPPLTPSEFLDLWKVAGRKERGVDSTSVNLDGKKAKSYLNEKNSEQLLIAGKLCSHENRYKLAKAQANGAKMRSEGQVKPEGKQ